MSKYIFVPKKPKKIAKKITLRKIRYPGWLLFFIKKISFLPKQIFLNGKKLPALLNTLDFIALQQNMQKI